MKIKQYATVSAICFLCLTWVHYRSSVEQNTSRYAHIPIRNEIDRMLSIIYWLYPNDFTESELDLSNFKANVTILW